MKIKSFEDIDGALLEAGRLETAIAKKEAEMNSKIQEVRDKYDQETKADRESKTEVYDTIEEFCNDHKEDFDKVRTKVFVHGSIGFATNPPKVLQLNSKWKTDKSIEAIKKLMKSLYIRTVQKIEIDKEAVLRDYQRKNEAGKVILDEKKLAGVGLRVNQEERFEVVINWESLTDKAA